jgi:hypothetical protein
MLTACNWQSTGFCSVDHVVKHTGRISLWVHMQAVKMQVGAVLMA